MAQVGMKHRFAWPLVGAVTAAATVVAGWAPVSQAAPSMGAVNESSQAKAIPQGAEGVYESCDAYFGFGKGDNAIDVVSFDVSDQNGNDGVAHAVGTDTKVVFVLTNAGGDTLECVAPEITAQAWQGAMDSVTLFIPNGKSLPTYPGPGHYAYPSVSYGPYISSNDPEVDDFGYVKAVAFKVVNIPDGHTLVSPTTTKALVQHYPLGDTGYSDVNDPQVLAYLQAQAGAAARDAFEAAVPEGGCNGDVEVSADLKLAIDTLMTYRGLEDDMPYTCSNVRLLNAGASFLLGLDAARSYVEPIVLKVPAETTTSTTSTTSPTTSTTGAVKTATANQAPVAQAQAPRPVSASPTYTG